MKTAALILAGTLLAPIPALADGPGGIDKSHRGHKGHEGMQGSYRAGPEMRLERLTRALDLTEDQQSVLKDVLAENPEAARADRQAMRQARQTLDAAVQADTFNESAIRDAAADVAAKEADLAVQRAAKLQQLRQVLTPEQLEKFQQIQERRADRGERGQRGSRARRGGPGGRGGMNRQ